MRAATLFILAAIMVAIPMSAAAASASQDAMKNCNAQWKTLDAATKGGTTHNAFMSSCMKGGASSTMNSVTGAAGNAVTGATNAVGNAASSVGHAAGSAVRGATNAVGGATGAAGAAVGSAMGMGATKTASHSHSKIPVEGNTGTAARCKDGTTMQIHTHSGACSHHGGVAAWL